MIKQFLLNADGTVPPNVNIDLLEAEGIPMVLPTEQWRPQDGFILEERSPEQDEDGVWRQVWVEVPVPPCPQTTQTLDLAEQVAILLARVAELEGK